jgi:hypothetical protein
VDNLTDHVADLVVADHAVLESRGLLSGQGAMTSWTSSAVSVSWSNAINA